MSPRVSLILPVHNQADHIAGVVRGCIATLEDLAVTHEIILVPNGSCSDSNEACARLAVELPAVRCVAIEGLGWGKAVRRGISEAQGDLICFTNSARTRPQDIGQIIDFALRTRGTVIKAVRKVRNSTLRRAGSLLYNILCTTLFDLQTADVNGTPKVFPRSAVGLLNLRRDDDLLDLEFMWRCRRDGLTVAEIPVYVDARHGGNSTTDWGTAWKLYTGAICFWYRARSEGRSQ